MAKYDGVRKVETKKENTYEISFQIDGKRMYSRVQATSMKDAYLIRTQIMAEKIQQSRVGLCEQYDEIEIETAYEALINDLKAELRPRKTINRYKKVFDRLYRVLRKKKYPKLKAVSQTTLKVVHLYKSYYVNDLGNKGWNKELVFVKSMIGRFYKLGLCERQIVEDVRTLKTPKANRVEYRPYPDSKIREVLNYMKRDRSDYYRIIYYIARTGRRIEESTLIERRDVIWHGFRPIKINIRAETTKQRKPLPIKAIDDDLAIVIQDANSVSKGRKDPYLFLNKHNHKCSQGRVRDYLKRVSKNILGDAITLKHFRKRFLTNCANNKVPMQDAMSIAGITDIKVVLAHYSYVSEEGLNKALGSSII